MESFTFSTSQSRLDTIDRLNRFNSKSDFINKAIDIYIEHLKTKYLTDFIYYIGFPFIALFGFVGLSMFFLSWFFYVCTIIIGIYLCILIFLFISKYRRKK